MCVIVTQCSVVYRLTRSIWPGPTDHICWFRTHETTDSEQRVYSWMRQYSWTTAGRDRNSWSTAGWDSKFSWPSYSNRLTRLTQSCRHSTVVQLAPVNMVGFASRPRAAITPTHKPTRTVTIHPLCLPTVLLWQTSNVNSWSAKDADCCSQCCS